MPINPFSNPKYSLTGYTSTFSTDEDDIEDFIEKYGIEKILKQMDTEKVNMYLRNKKLNKLKNGRQ